MCLKKVFSFPFFSRFVFHQLLGMNNSNNKRQRQRHNGRMMVLWKIEQCRILRSKKDGKFMFASKKCWHEGKIKKGRIHFNRREFSINDPICLIWFTKIVRWKSLKGRIIFLVCTSHSIPSSISYLLYVF